MSDIPSVPPSDNPFTSALPRHLACAQTLVDRIETSAERKLLIVTLGLTEAITPDEAHLLITANQLETA